MRTSILAWWLAIALLAVILMLWTMGFGSPRAEQKPPPIIESMGSSASSTSSSTCASTGNKTICYNEYSSMTCTKTNNVTTCEVIRK